MAERRFAVDASSSDIFGRVLVSARTNHFVIDGPDYNDCPGEAVTPPEAFLAGVLSCGVELMQVIARDEGIGVRAITGRIEGMVDPEARVRDDVMVFNSVRIEFAFTGCDPAEASALVDGYRNRCPLYGSVAASCPDVAVGSSVVGLR